MPYVFQTLRKDGKPHPRWRFQFTDWRGQKRTATGTTSKSETARLAIGVQAEQDAIRKGWRPPPKLSAVPRSFQDALDEYFAWGGSQGGRGGRPWGTTHARMRRAYLAWWREHLKVEIVADLDGILPRVEKALRERETAGRSGKTLQNYAESLSAFCNWCVSRGYLDADPLRGLAPFDTAPRTIRRAMTTDEITKLLGSCAPHRRLGYEVAFASGLRAGELRALRIRHLDRNAAGLHLEAAWTKNRKAGFQPLPTWIVTRLAEESRNKTPESPLLYVSSHPARDLDEDLTRAGIPKSTREGKLDFHACRVAFVSWVVEAGASIKEAQVLARHATPGLTLNTYARAREGRLADVAEAVGKNLLSTTGAQRKNAQPVSRVRAADKVVEAAGIEPETAGELPLADVGRDEPKVGQNGSQAGQPEGLTGCPACKGRTAPGPSETKPGRETSTIGAQQPSRVDAGNPGASAAAGSPPDQHLVSVLPEEVREIIDVWPTLPESLRDAVIAIVRAMSPRQAPGRVRRRGDDCAARGE